MAWQRYDVTVVGGGPAGLCAAIEAAAAPGLRIALIDENPTLGGQLPKQTHKFFGSPDQYGGVRGFRIARLLNEQIKACAIDVFLDSTVWFIDGADIAFRSKSSVERVTTRALVLACGAREKPLCFPGWTLPGVLGAGALQTMVNLWRVAPGPRILVVGSGNVGLIVTFQMMQAGLEVVAVVESSSRIGGYQIHANKVLRLGVPIYLNSRILSAHGNGRVERVSIEIDGRVRQYTCDVICLAVGMYPNLELPRAMGVSAVYQPDKGYYIPEHDAAMQVPGKNIFVCGDMCGVEEASIAIEEGRLAGLSAKRSLGLSDSMRYRLIQRSLKNLRGGKK